MELQVQETQIKPRKSSLLASWSLRDKLLIGGAIVLLTALNVALFIYGENAKSLLEIFNSPAASQDAIKVVSIEPQILDPALQPARDDTYSPLVLPMTGEPEQKPSTVLAPALPTGPVVVTGSQLQTLAFDKEAVLTDSDNRIDDQFNVTPSLKKRVSFWFDIYTKYDENQRVIHYSLRPWIVFKVVDVTEILNAKTPRHRWLRNVKADKYVASELKKIRMALVSVAKRKSLKKLNAYEQIVVEALKPLGGKVQMNARMAATTTRVQLGQKNFFEEGLKISGAYFKEMENIFAKEKLPIELTRLPLVESSFNHFATSKDGAAGIWQFMGDTGRKFMTVNDQIDERRSPFKATEAAARLLKENHLILYHQWPLALTAYNHGPGGVRAAVKATRTKDLGEIAMRYHTKMFNFASANYYSGFLAALHAEMYKDKIWGNRLAVNPALETHFVRLSRAFRVSRLVKLTGLSKEMLLEHNPDFKKVFSHNGILPAGIRFYIPNAMQPRLEKLLAQNEAEQQRKVARRKG